MVPVTTNQLLVYVILLMGYDPFHGIFFHSFDSSNDRLKESIVNV